MYVGVLRHPAESGKCDEGTELSYMTGTITVLIYGGPLSDSFGGGGHLFPRLVPTMYGKRVSQQAQSVTSGLARQLN